MKNEATYQCACGYSTNNPIAWEFHKAKCKQRVNWNSGIASVAASIVIITLCSFCLPDRWNWPGGGGDEADQRACKKCGGTGSCSSCGGSGVNEPTPKGSGLYPWRDYLDLHR